MAKLRGVAIDFVDAAPVRWVFEGVVAAGRDRVFGAVSGDAKAWSDWFPGVSDGGYDGDPRLGARRWVRANGVRFDETVIAWDEPARWAFRVDETVAPLAAALVEQWTFEDRDGSTLVRWTFAAEPRVAMRVAAPVMRRTMQRLFDRAMSNLSKRLSD